MTRTPPVTDAEWEVMNVLWDESPRTANDVIELLSERMKWHATTVKTLLSRLVKKGVVRYRSEGNRYLYFFKARKGQRLTVRLVSDDGNAVCDVMSHGQFDANPVVEETVDWTGRLPEADAGEYSVEVRSTGGLAKYVLEITIK